METDNKRNYSWFKVHKDNFINELRIGTSGVIKNFKRISWHTGKPLLISYLQILVMLIFLTAFCFLVFLIVSKI